MDSKDSLMIAGSSYRARHAVVNSFLLFLMCFTLSSSNRFYSLNYFEEVTDSRLLGWDNDHITTMFSYNLCTKDLFESSLKYKLREVIHARARKTGIQSSKMSSNNNFHFPPIFEQFVLSKILLDSSEKIEAGEKLEIRIGHV
jgi:hypothetical protein